jgi:hypothetical protein
MSDLIWIGNTLYPRWIVFLALALIVTVVIGVPMLAWLLFHK